MASAKAPPGANPQQGFVFKRPLDRALIDRSLYKLSSADDEDDDDASGVVVKSAKGKKLPPNVAAAKSRIPEVTISPDAQPDLKKALEVLLHCFQLTR